MKELNFNVDYGALEEIVIKKGEYRSTYLFKKGHKRKGVKSWVSVYEAVGICLEDLKESFNDGERIDVMQIYCNKKTHDKISNTIKAGYIKDNFSDKVVGMDSLQYSPVIDDRIPDDLIVIRDKDAINEWRKYQEITREEK